MRNARPALFALTALALLAAAAQPALAASKAPTNWDGLVPVKGRSMDFVYVMPGADFRPYTKVMLDPTEVAFKKNWLRDMNDSVNTSRRMTDGDAAKIMEAARSGFEDIFREAFEQAGYQVVTAPGPDVLRIGTGVADLYINAPAAIEPVGVSRTYTANAGEATLIVEVRDSQTNALMGRVVDQRETRTSAGQMQRSSSVTNRSDFRDLFKNWARICAKGLGELKALSPVPADLQPNQKLPR
jgi:hypothetical protein